MRALWRLAAAGAVLALQGCAAIGDQDPGPAAASGPAGRSTADAVRAQGVVDLPIEIHHGYVLVAGQVNGQPGRFMLDSGTPYRFFLNRNAVPLTVGPELARGRAGSGQAIVVHAALDVAALQLAGHAELPDTDAPPASGMQAADFGFLQQLIPDFLGFVGAPWMAQHVLALRYAPAQLLLADADTGADRLQQGSERVTLIHFAGQDGALPYALFQLGGIHLRALFDTGNPGSLQLTAEAHARLTQAGALHCNAGPPVTCVPLALHHGPHLLESDALPLTIGADNRIVLGAGLLQRHVSVWNLRAGTLDLRRDNSR